MLHLVPFQCAARVSPWGPLWSFPTAQTSSEVIALAATANWKPRDGEATVFQLVPSKCWNIMRIWLLFGSRFQPTAQRSEGPTPVIASRTSAELGPVDGLGLETVVQLRPSQCSMSVLSCWFSAF